MDISKIGDPTIKDFIEKFLKDREINKEFYKQVPEKKFDFRMVNTPKRKSDSPRESLIHQIAITRDYINALKTGILQFGIKYEDLTPPHNLTKDALLRKFDETEEELIELLCNPAIVNKKIKVPWSKEPIAAISALWGLDSHEILHQGWNLAIMDHLDIKRFKALKNMWG